MLSYLSLYEFAGKSQAGDSNTLFLPTYASSKTKTKQKPATDISCNLISVTQQNWFRICGQTRGWVWVPPSSLLHTTASLPEL